MAEIPDYRTGKFLGCKRSFFAIIINDFIIEKETDRVLGIGIVGKGAGELISEGTLSIEMGATAKDLAETIHPHPTLSETVMECAESIYGGATHIIIKRQ